MLDFLKISYRSTKRGVTEIYPRFKICRSKDLMIRGGKFFAIWDEERNLWSTDWEDVIRLIDTELDRFVENEYGTKAGKTDDHIVILYMWDADSGSAGRWKNYCEHLQGDNYHQLNEKLIFANQVATKEDYASITLPYALENGECKAWNELTSVLYSPEELHKIEWAIGAIVTGASKTLQKFLVFYGPPGSGKSTIIEIIQKLFKGYYCIFDSKALGSNNNAFALEPFKDNPLVAIEHDGDLSRIEDNTKLNSVVSHELITVNEKHKNLYTQKFIAFLILGTNSFVKITDSKSGIIRRLIDVRPTGKKLSLSKYNSLMKQIEFELGHIASHCRDVYLENPNYYADYRPVLMMSESNDFFNFVSESFSMLNKEDGITLKQAYEMYKIFCEESKVPHILTKRLFKSELMNYFENYYERVTLNGLDLKNYFSGFKTEILYTGQLVNEIKESNPDTSYRIEFKEQPSNLDEFCKDCYAQYANSKDLPYQAWDKVTTKLKDIDTHKTHYLRVPTVLVVIDFDLRDENGNKSFEKNLEAASKFPPTYAELSKSGGGIHLHYIYKGDPGKLSRIYADSIEIKVYTGKSSLRRKLTKCNDLPIMEITGGLPVKEDKKKEITDMNNLTGVKFNRYLINLIHKNLNKEIHGATKPSMDFIYKILEDAYESGKSYDVTKLKGLIIQFAAASTNQSDYCLSLIPKMHFKSEEDIEEVNVIQDNNDKPIGIFDLEVFPNVSFVNYKEYGKKTMYRLINPKPFEIEKMINNYRLIGYNNRKYDNHILYGMLLGLSPLKIYNLSQDIINRKTGWYAEAYGLSYTDIFDYCSKKQTLKKWEIDLGLHHLELGLPWDQPVPEELWPRVSAYCDNDVVSTEAVFDHTQADFLAREALVNIANILDKTVTSCVNDTNNTLSGRIIFRGNKHPQDNFIYTDLTTGERSDGTKDPMCFPGYRYYNVGMKNKKLVDIAKSIYTEDEEVTNSKVISIYCHNLTTISKYKLPKNGTWLDDELEALIENLIDSGEVDLLGEGGYVWHKTGMYSHVLTKDVRSMHPHEIKELNLFGKYTDNFFDLVTLRLAIKDKDWATARNMLNGALEELIPENGLNDDAADTLAYALKIAINSVYGLTSAHFDNLFRDPRNVDNIVAKRSALIMCQLRHIVSEMGGQVIHIKTDSIKLVQPSDSLLDFIDNYGAKYGLTFDIEARYEKICLVNKAVYVAKYEADMPKHGGEWTATGTQFAIPYVFKKCFTKEPIEFSDLCETKSVKSAMYLDMNEDIDQTNYDLYSRLEKARFKNANDKELKKYEVALLDEYASVTDEELKDILSGYHNYRFIGKVGLFCPIKPGCGGGELVRENLKKDGSIGMDAVTGTKGYRWLEAEEVFEKNKQNDIDLGYYDTLVNNAIKDISEFGDYEWFIAEDDEDYKASVFINGVPRQGVDAELPF